GQSRQEKDPGEVGGPPVIEFETDLIYFGKPPQDEIAAWVRREDKLALYRSYPDFVDVTGGTYHDWYQARMDLDLDGDCLTGRQELELGTDDMMPDTDLDGWFDGPCNYREQIMLDQIIAHNLQEDAFYEVVEDDEIYLIIDGVRYPNRRSDLDDYWVFEDGEPREFNDYVVAERVRGVELSPFAAVDIALWEDDFELQNEWADDQRMGGVIYDFLDWAGSVSFQIRDRELGVRYELRLSKERVYFADPDPLNEWADSDRDGITDYDESRIARDFGGITDPERKDLFIEVDHMPGNALNSRAAFMISTAFHRMDINAVVFRDEQVAANNCLNEREFQNWTREYFDNRDYNAFRYVLMARENWREASALRKPGALLIDDSWWWIDGDAQAQAGTLMHELGHDLGLLPDAFPWIDDVLWSIEVEADEAGWHSSMNYLRQPYEVRFDTNVRGHNEWEVVHANMHIGLGNRFLDSWADTDGACGDNVQEILPPAGSGHANSDFQRHQY
ncbi:MAG: hypothetical protein KC561_16575, partial [Myxococcales bacterium]|nr:hypothetical protein [Myxococcales bacterium]